MYRGHASRKILPSLAPNDKPSIHNHIPEFLLAGEPLNTLHQILVALAVSRHQLPNQGNGTKAPALVNGIKQRILVDLAKLEHGQHAAGLEDAVGLAQGLWDIAKVADAKGDSVQVDRVVGDAGGGEVLCVGLEEGQGGLLGGGELLGGALAADGEHGGVDVGDGDAHVGVGVDNVRVVQVAEGNVAGAAGNVEDVLGGRWGGCGCVVAWVEGGDVVVSVVVLVSFWAI